MTERLLDSRIEADLRDRLQRGLTSGEILTPAQVTSQVASVQERFSPSVLRGTDGEALLRLMHGREDNERRRLMYWLEFKNDDQFAGTRFGTCQWRSALKFGIYQAV